MFEPARSKSRRAADAGGPTDRVMMDGMGGMMWGMGLLWLLLVIVLILAAAALVKYLRS